MEIIWLIIAGAIVGALGRLINPGRDPMGWLLTIGIGIASMVIVGLIADGAMQWILGIIVAAVLVTVVQKVLPGDDRRVTA